MGFKVRKKRRFKSVERFVEQIKKIQKEAKVTLVKAQEDMKKYTDRHRSKVVEYKERDLVLLSTKDLKWQIIGRQSEKLTECYVEPYKIKRIVSPNVIKLELPNTVKIHLVVNISKIRIYSNQVLGQRVEEPKPVIVRGHSEASQNTLKYSIRGILS